MFRVAAILPLLVDFSHADPLKCATGWNGEAKVIPSEWINDGYCDCPLDGKDEPDTAACAGSSAWPGVASVDASFQLFVCPEQPNLKLPSSRIGDGICDCCDGADEPAGSCTDICEQVLKEEREARAKLEADFVIGHRKRNEELNLFSKMREEKLSEAQAIETRLAGWKSDEIKAQIKFMKQEYMIQKKEVVKRVVSAHSEIVSHLSTDKLKLFITHACQLSGEMSTDDTETCVALRLAALDMGITWDDENYENPDRTAISDQSTQEVANLIFENAVSSTPSWKLGAKKGNGRRRLQEDDDYMGEYGGDYDGYDDYDHYDMTDDLYDPEYNEPEPEQKEGEEHLSGIRSLGFSTTRVAFLDRLNVMNSQISDILEKASSDDEKEPSDEEMESTEQASTEPAIDPAAYTMLRSNFRRKEATIVKGFRWGASAQFFLQKWEDEDRENEKLIEFAMGTIYYGKLSAVQVWQILQVILTDIEFPEISSETCASPWVGSCPPQKIPLYGVADYPPSYIMDAAQEFCSKQGGKDFESVCSAHSEVLPLSIPDGYFGYSEEVPRSEDDPLTSFFAPISSLKADMDKLASLEEQLSESEHEKKELEKTVKKIWKDIGGKDGTALGPAGELQSLADQCFDIKQGKYTYEVCIFGQAKQKEGNSGGTGLGKWSEMSTDDKTGERVMYWKGGQKCWNGPQRSATVYVTCGAETKILSADEPDTCRYVFTLESHIGCDEDYKKRMGL